MQNAHVCVCRNIHKILDFYFEFLATNYINTYKLYKYIVSSDVDRDNSSARARARAHTHTTHDTNKINITYITQTADSVYPNRITSVDAYDVIVAQSTAAICMQIKGA